MATIKRYSFPNEATAAKLLMQLAPAQLKGTFKQLTKTTHTDGIVCDVRPQPVIDANGKIILKEHTTYDVDIMWSAASHPDFEPYEINPKTPNHNFAL